jgi:hypothetical protein
MVSQILAYHENQVDIFGAQRRGIWRRRSIAAIAAASPAEKDECRSQKQTNFSQKLEKRHLIILLHHVSVFTNLA